MSDSVPSLETIRRALAIADKSATADVVMSSMRRYLDNSGCWFELFPDPLTQKTMAERIAYLDGRGLLIRHPEESKYFRIKTTA